MKWHCMPVQDHDIELVWVGYQFGYQVDGIIVFAAYFDCWKFKIHYSLNCAAKCNLKSAINFLEK